MSVWLTPELKPFFGGTYFPPENRYGHPGFASILTQIAEAWEQRSRADRRFGPRCGGAAQEQHVEPVAATGRRAVRRGGVLDSGFSIFRRTFDPRARRLRRRSQVSAPLGPQLPAALLRAHEEPGSARHGAAHAARDGQGRHARPARRRLPSLLGGRALVRAALREDALRPGAARHLLPGSLPDHRRPAVRRHRAPHLRLRAARHDRSRRRLLFGRRCRQRDRPARSPIVKGEGAFYIWTAEEIRSSADQPAADWFCYRYGVAEGGNVANDPHGEFTGKNILYQAHTVEETAEQFGRPVGRSPRRTRSSRRASCWQPAPSACARTSTTRSSPPGTA